jgi:hypothetical protein
MRNIAIVLGIIFAVIALVYWLVPASSLPGFFPGFEAGSTRVQARHRFRSHCHRTICIRLVRGAFPSLALGIAVTCPGRSAAWSGAT